MSDAGPSAHPNQQSPSHVEVDLGAELGENVLVGGRGMSKRAGTQSEDDTDDDDGLDQRHHVGHVGPSAMLSPSSPEDGDMDPAASLLNRRERDDQERLDLEEEMRERVMSEAQGELGAGFADLDMQDRKLGETGKTSQGPERGEC